MKPALVGVNDEALRIIREKSPEGGVSNRPSLSVRPTACSGSHRPLTAALLASDIR